LDVLIVWPQCTASDDGAQFLDQLAAAFRSLGAAAEFKGEASHGAEIWGGIALVHMIEQSGANIVDRMDVDSGLGVGQTVDAPLSGAFCLIENAVNE
jgi:hypothetical protein